MMKYTILCLLLLTETEPILQIDRWAARTCHEKTCDPGSCRWTGKVTCDCPVGFNHRNNSCERKYNSSCERKYTYTMPGYSLYWQTLLGLPLRKLVKTG